MREISQLVAELHGLGGPVCYAAKIKFAEEMIGELERLARSITPRHCVIRYNSESVTRDGRLGRHIGLLGLWSAVRSGCVPDVECDLQTAEELGADVLPHWYWSRTSSLGKIEFPTNSVSANLNRRVAVLFEHMCNMRNGTSLITREGGKGKRHPHRELLQVADCDIARAVNYGDQLFTISRAFRTELRRRVLLWIFPVFAS